MLLNLRRGKFSLPVPLIEAMPDRVQALMATCIVISAEHAGGVIVYEALSDLFKPIKENEPVPEYAAVFDDQGAVLTWQARSDRAPLGSGASPHPQDRPTAFDLDVDHIGSARAG